MTHQHHSLDLVKIAHFRILIQLLFNEQKRPFVPLLASAINLLYIAICFKSLQACTVELPSNQFGDVQINLVINICQVCLYF